MSKGFQDTIYDYDPRPPNVDNPPISAHEFEAAFASCSNQRMLASFHGCRMVSHGEFALNLIPKRNLEFKIKADGREQVWALQARHTISFIPRIVLLLPDKLQRLWFLGMVARQACKMRRLWR